MGRRGAARRGAAGVETGQAGGRGAAGKVTTLAEAIAAHVTDGASVVMGCGLEGRIPFAAGYEMIRQRRRGLTLIGPISDILFDLLIGAGCADEVRAAWVGNVSDGLGYCFRRAVEGGRLRMHDYSNLTLGLALQAGAWGLPFLPTRSAGGTDVVADERDFRPVADPFGGRDLLAVRAIVPDVAVVHVQRADPDGNAHLWGNLGVSVEGARAARRVILTCEEIVAPEVIRRDPNRTLIPGFLVAAVVHAPRGAHPSPVPGHYDRDNAFYHQYHERTRQDPSAWIDEWVLDLADHDAYLAKLGAGRLGALDIREPVWSEAINVGC